MSRLSVAPIVEGHGEVESIRKLVERIWYELVGGAFINVLQPIRQPRSKLVKPDELARALKFAALKLQKLTVLDDRQLVLLLVDADRDCPGELGPKLLGTAQAFHTDLSVSCVIANIEYETWFVAAAESLSGYLKLDPGEHVPDAPEAHRYGKGWIQRRFKGLSYSETQDQPAMTAAMDLAVCRSRSPSFDKLCRELEKQLDTAS